MLEEEWNCCTVLIVAIPAWFQVQCTIAMKVIAIFGNNTMTLVPVTVG
jgi:hypothetical protein